MSKCLPKGKNQNGVTYIEVMVCIIIMGLVVGPIAFHFLSANLTKLNAEHVNEATSNAEKLMVQIEDRMTQDIDLYDRSKTRGNTILDSVYNALGQGEIEKYVGPSPNYTAVDSLTKFLRIPSSEQAEFDKIYDTDKYSYEVALWNLADLSGASTPLDTSDDFDLSSNTFKVNEKLDKAYKACSYDQTGWKWDNIPSNLPVTMKLNSEEVKRAFADPYERYLPLVGSEAEADASGYKIYDKVTIEVDSSGVPSTKGTRYGRIKADYFEIKNGGHIVGYQIEISKLATAPNINPSSDVVIIEFNPLQVIRNASDMSAITSYDQYTYRFMNKTGTYQIIAVDRTALKQRDITLNGSGSIENETMIRDKFNIQAISETPNGNPKTTILDTEPIQDKCRTYIVAIIVREKQPAQGNEGKIVKKMFNLYTYDEHASERW